MTEDLSWRQRHDAATAIFQRDPARGINALLDVYVQVIKTGHHQEADSIGVEIEMNATPALLKLITARRASVTDAAARRILEWVEGGARRQIARRVPN